MDDGFNLNLGSDVIFQYKNLFFEIEIQNKVKTHHDSGISL